MNYEKTAALHDAAGHAVDDTNALPLGRRSPKQGGFGALEVLIALVIGMLVIMAAVSWQSKLSSSSNNNDELSNISTLITNTRVLKTASGYGATGTDLVPIMINSGGIPDTMERTDSEVFNIWHGAVTLVSSGTGFELTYEDIPMDNCIVLATKAAGSSGLTTSINGGSAIIGEVTASAANTACSQDANTLSWASR